MKRLILFLNLFAILLISSCGISSPTLINTNTVEPIVISRPTLTAKQINEFNSREISVNMASKEDAFLALSAGVPFLEQLSPENHAGLDYFKPIVLRFRVLLSASETALWGFTWCAVDKDTMEYSFSQINLKFILNTKVVLFDEFSIYEFVSSNSQQCRLIYTALSGWQGEKHEAMIVATFTSTINDGVREYSPGDYVFDYQITVTP
jgi:hypothetical protein